MHKYIVHVKLTQCSMSVMATKVQGVGTGQGVSLSLRLASERDPTVRLTFWETLRKARHARATQGTFLWEIDRVSSMNQV